MVNRVKDLDIEGKVKVLKHHLLLYPSCLPFTDFGNGGKKKKENKKNNKKAEQKMKSVMKGLIKKCVNVMIGNNEKWRKKTMKRGNVGIWRSGNGKKRKRRTRQRE